MNRKKIIKRLWWFSLLLAITTTTVQAQVDEIRLKPATGQTSGRVVRGTISTESTTDLRMTVNGRPENFKIEEIDEITYAGMPSAYLEAEAREKSGDYQAALDGFKKAASSAGLRPLVAQLVKFRYAEALALAASEDPDRTSDAITALREFVSQYPTSRNAPDAMERLLNIVRTGDDQSQIDSVIAELSKMPGAQIRANLLKADVLVERGEAEEAIKVLDSNQSAVSKNSESDKIAQAIRIKALVANKKLPEAEKLAQTLIDESDPNDFASLASAYNSLGDCLRAAGKPKDAMIAYLHTEILYERASSEHARALAAITELWRILEKPDRAEQTLSKLATSYPKSPWLKKVQAKP